MRHLHASALIVLTLCSLRSLAAGPAAKQAQQVPHWREPARVALELRGGKSNNVANWEIHLAKHGDFLLDVAEPSEAGSPKGQILVLGGQVMAVHGLELEKGYEIDALDMPAFHFQLLYSLLEAVFPAGPESISETREVDHSENDVPITVGTASATGEFAAPWYVLGTVSRKDKHTIAYDLSFTFMVDPETATMFKLRLLGIWTDGTEPQDIGDDFNIQGWTVYSIGPFQSDTDQGSVMEFGAQPTGESYRTAGELRTTLGDMPDDKPDE